nr:helix-turn-helix transcriptional regulator [Streptomyces dengpaensis]
MVLAWDARGVAAGQEWLDLRSETEEQLALYHSAEISRTADSDSQPAIRTPAVPSREGGGRRPHNPVDPNAPGAALAVTLRSLRRKAGNPPIRAISHAAGLSQSTVSRMLRGDRMPSLAAVTSVASVLETDEKALARVQEEWERTRWNDPSSAEGFEEEWDWRQAEHDALRERLRQRQEQLRWSEEELRRREERLAQLEQALADAQDAAASVEIDEVLKRVEERSAQLEQALADARNAAVSNAAIEQVGSDLTVWANDVQAEDDGIVDVEIVDEGSFSGAPALPSGEALSGQ